MNRAERRRQGKAMVKKPTYNLDRSQISNLIQNEYRDTIKWNRMDAYNEAVSDAFVMMMALPMKVLKDHYWTKSSAKRLPEFSNYVLELFNAWQNDELSMDDIVEELERDSKVKLVWRKEK